MTREFKELLGDVELFEGIHKPPGPLPEHMQPFKDLFGDYEQGTSWIWWDVLDDATYKGYDVTIAAVKKRVAQSEPNVLAGFSQGAAVTWAYLLECALRDEDPKISKAVCCAPPMLRHPPLLEKLASSSFPKIKVPVLFFFGKTDEWCSFQEDALTTFMNTHFESWDVHLYPGGHIIPTDSASIQKANDFLQSEVARH